ncbi:uncharacterized protein LOC134187426 [Corticium candelabrum]|uniref:uncharacterized protein LOC134187426 n=1 Tax=Corticium candelabrum TaxID=121492 RepID=UPI002E25F509|nr:uncharacterized protein LOC134187426 [Corticium candelabrum]
MMSMAALLLVCLFPLLFMNSCEAQRVLSDAAEAGSQSSQAPLLPQPQTFTMGLDTASVCSMFVFRTPQRSELLMKAFQHYKKLIFGHESRMKLKSNCVKGVVIIVSDVSTTHNLYPSLETNESYTLTVSKSGYATLKAITEFGALRGLETFSQLVTFNFTHKLYQVSNTPWNIIDFPRFQHRGLLIDTARHFQPVTNIKRVLDSMAYAKLNVMHWHIVDTQSFPMEVRKYPNMWEGAYSFWERYTQEDIYSITEHARLRGIRVIPEFDIPGHAASWCAGYPDLCPSSTCTQPLNPSKNLTFEIIEDLLKEVTGQADAPPLFPDRFLHLGGDEVNVTCWETSSAVNRWMRKNNLDSYEDVYKHFVQYGHRVSESIGRNVINWEEVSNNFGNTLNSNTVIQIWISQINIANVVRNGYRCIDSYENHWYLDWHRTKWQTVYTHEPCKFVHNKDDEKLVIGGEVCAWGEYIDGSDLDSTIWPRAAAAAERLWSRRDVNDIDSMEPRLASFRCLLHRRGITSSPLQSDARREPFGPGGCNMQ